ncbi:hypothetical protein CAOG_02754 [Capsaspora owczarzaki ATCC 30864]|uniref:Uncharacterized protein n=1 Tax=Capsaspora owczarzaki (strain ATCC 30864) TaxID=595528 RepID=A0A0D2U9D0_CAPO3|nr:hypothetical protein CAOG_02754 [Capsaspora owczarzaki ATCC 30864]KJE91646.1 hypothetical protein CAOG_002754 [Capsaspora owczarzaki ATCC 30864]|eukprot:XP_004349504.1 hypothetical protein CAOG_02754 [Capsaspora owczarzaki ATCC 30864]
MAVIAAALIASTAGDAPPPSAQRPASTTDRAGDAAHLDVPPEAMRAKQLNKHRAIQPAHRARLAAPTAAADIEDTAADAAAAAAAAAAPDIPDEAQLMYARLFRTKRVEHLDAVERMLQMQPKHQSKLLPTLISTVFEVLEKSRATLDGVQPGDAIPAADLVKHDALSSVLENLVFFADMMLRFPAIVHPLVDSNQVRLDLLMWALFLGEQSPVYSENDLHVLDLLKQEANIIPKDENFVNPFGKRAKMKAAEDAAYQKRLEAEAANAEARKRQPKRQTDSGSRRKVLLNRIPRRGHLDENADSSSSQGGIHGKTAMHDEEDL